MEIGKICRVEDDRCYTCKEKGHHSKDCPKKERWRKERKEERIVCTFCDSSGHHVSVCRKKMHYKEEQAKNKAIKKRKDG